MSDELSKMKIVAYKDPEFNEKVEEGEFTSLVNPESYSYKYKIDTDDEQPPGTSATEVKFNKIKPEELNFEFIFDSTGALPGAPASEEGVVNDVEKLKKVVLEYNGETHKPNYLRISWGTLLFKGTLTQMDVNFKLFKSDGTPIRAKAKGKFKGFVEDNLRAAKENAQSPDLTHIVVVKEGDTLPLMCSRVYGDPNYYMHVAAYNNIFNFRKVEAGTELFFPPIDKSAQEK
ncbi:MAG: hypothetical protein V5A59_09895 [Bacteroidales bacterium]